MDTKQHREDEVHSLLEKFGPNIIALDPDSVGRGQRRGEQFNPATAMYEGYDRGGKCAKNYRCRG